MHSESGEHGSGTESGENRSDSESGEHGSGTESGENRSDSESGEHGSGTESGENRSDSESGEHGSGTESGENRSDSESGEHSGGTESGDGGEEAGTQFALDETFDEIRAGARLVLSYDSTSNAFIGNVENTTDATLRRVRVEVHLSNGTELGPTTPTDLGSRAVARHHAAGNRPALHYLERPPRGRLIAHARNGAGGMDCGVSRPFQETFAKPLVLSRKRQSSPSFP